MTDVPMHNTDPPVQEGVFPDLSKLQIDGNAKEGEICLSDLPQCYIDRICQHLDLKSVIRLQKTCKDLNQKGFIARRLVAHPLKITYFSVTAYTYRLDLGKKGFSCLGPTSTYFRLHAGKFLGPTSYQDLVDTNSWDEKEFQRKNFRFIAKFLHYCETFTLDMMKQLDEALAGRGTIEKMQIGMFDVGRDYAYFNQFLLQHITLKALRRVSEILEGRGTIRQLMVMERDSMQFSPTKLALFLQMKNLVVRMPDVPLSLRYFLDTDIHSCQIILGWENRAHSEEMHDVMEKWAKNEKEITKFAFYNFHFDVQTLFRDWVVINEGEEVPPDRPFVIKRPIALRFGALWASKYRVIRADGNALSVVKDHWMGWVYFGTSVYVADEALGGM